MAAAETEDRKTDISVSPDPMSEAHLRLRWRLRFPNNVMNDEQWRSYWQGLDHMDPLLAPEHPLAERVAPPPDGIASYAVRADLWHRITAVLF